ncbi:hypothetical protein ACFX12_023759 [Malus domestica]
MDPTQIPGPPPPKGSTVEQQKDIGLRAVKLPSADAIRTTLGFLTEIRRGLPGRNEAGSFWGEIGTKSLLGQFAYHDSQTWNGSGRRVRLRMRKRFVLRCGLSDMVTATAVLFHWETENPTWK